MQKYYKFRIITRTNVFDALQQNKLLILTFILVFVYE